MYRTGLCGLTVLEVQSQEVTSGDGLWLAESQIETGFHAARDRGHMCVLICLSVLRKPPGFGHGG
jgi:hypothetical protein